jgi:ADP-ribosyl-[dinitrogen reductase] hydrolase
LRLHRPHVRRQRLADAVAPGAAGVCMPPGRRDRAFGREFAYHPHGAASAVDACRYLGGLIVGALQGASKEELLADCYGPIPGYWEAYPLEPEIAAEAAGSFKRRYPPEIQGTGYVVRSLEAALWAFDQTESFRDGRLLAMNLGDDADATGAVYGQLAGTFYGELGIPETWPGKLAHRALIQSFTDQLFQLSRTL